MKSSRIFALLASLLIILIVQPQQIRAERYSFKVGAYANAPKIYPDDQGEATGFWPDLLAHIAAQENWQIEYVWGTWSEGLERLEAGEIDILPDVAVTESRKELYEFSAETVLLSWSRFYIKEESPSYSSIFDLAGKKIAVLKNSVNYEGSAGIKELIGSFDIDCRFVEYASYQEAFKAVSDGSAYGAVANRNFGDKHEHDYHLKKTSLVFQPINVNFAFPKSSPHTATLAKTIDRNVKALKDDTGSTYFQLLEKYFETDIAERKYFVFPEWGKQLLTFLGISVLVAIIAAIFFRLRLKKSIQKIEQNRAQFDKAIMSERSFLRSLIDSADDAIYIKDINGNYLCCNKTSEKMIGLTEAEQIGKSDFDFFAQDFAEAIKEKDRVVFETGQSVRVEEALTTAEGDQVHLDSIKAPIFKPDGEIIGLVGISRDITARKQSEAKRLELEAQLRQKYKMEAVGIMAGGIAHDFNNILTIIMTNLELMRRKMGNEHALSPRIEQAFAASSRAGELVKQILTYSRQNTQAPQPLQLAIVVEEALKLLRSSIPASIEISTRIEMDARSAMIDADATQMDEVLINLCHNAVYAMNGKGLLTVSLSKESREEEFCSTTLEPSQNSYLKLTITDTGTGISAEILEKIFDPFFTTKPVGQGTGMGLSICNNIVKRHNGFMAVDSSPNNGSTFSAYFPILVSAHESNQQQAQEEPTEKLPTGSERILLIDDEEPLAQALGDYLVGLGYSVTTQTDSLKALALFESNPEQFDLVISDQTMPGLTGLELSLEMLKIKPQLPIILCTGYSANITEEKAKQQGIKEFFIKPLALPTLAQTTRNFLDGGKA